MFFYTQRSLLYNGTTYTANLNPFKPFTFANKKEKVVRKERTISSNVFVCNKCGKTFY